MDYIKIEEIDNEKKLFCAKCDKRARIQLSQKIGDEVIKEHLCTKHFKKTIKEWLKQPALRK